MTSSLSNNLWITGSNDGQFYMRPLCQHVTFKSSDNGTVTFLMDTIKIDDSPRILGEVIKFFSNHLYKNSSVIYICIGIKTVLTITPDKIEHNYNCEEKDVNLFISALEKTIRLKFLR